jgi:hypothetical protein
MSGVINRPKFATQGRHKEVGTTLDSPNGSFSMTINITKMLPDLPIEMLHELQLQINDELVKRRGNGK